MTSLGITDPTGHSSYDSGLMDDIQILGELMGWDSYFTDGEIPVIRFDKTDSPPTAMSAEDYSRKRIEEQRLSFIDKPKMNRSEMFLAKRKAQAAERKEGTCNVRVSDGAIHCHPEFTSTVSDVGANHSLGRPPLPISNGAIHGHGRPPPPISDGAIHGHLGKLSREVSEKSRDESSAREEKRKFAHEHAARDAERTTREEKQKMSREKADREAEWVAQAARKAERAAKEEKERMAREQAAREAERAAKEEKERLAREKAAREAEWVAQATRDAARAAREEEERLVREEAARVAREQAAREAERAAREKKERLALEEAARVAREQAAREAEAARVEREQAAREAERAAKEKKERLAREQAAREAERAAQAAREEEERMAREQAAREAERAAQAAREEEEKMAREQVDRGKEEENTLEQAVREETAHKKKEKHRLEQLDDQRKTKRSKVRKKGFKSHSCQLEQSKPQPQTSKIFEEFLLVEAPPPETVSQETSQINDKAERVLPHRAAHAKVYDKHTGEYTKKMLDNWCNNPDDVETVSSEEEVPEKQEEEEEVQGNCRKKRQRWTSCGLCSGCLALDCGNCTYCDNLSLRQKCKTRECLFPEGLGSTIQRFIQINDIEISNVDVALLLQDFNNFQRKRMRTRMKKRRYDKILTEARESIYEQYAKNKERATHCKRWVKLSSFFRKMLDEFDKKFKL